MFGGNKSATRSPVATAPKPTQQHAPAKQHAPAQGGGMMAGLGSTMMRGMAFGAGSEIAHQAVKSIMGSGSSNSNKHDNAPAETQNNQQQYQP